MKRRLVATVLLAKGTTRHYVGLPPQLNEGKDDRVEMPTARVLVVEIEIGKSDCLLFRFSREGTFAGDTWHETLDRAKAQADYEYVLASPWREVPPDVIDPVTWSATQTPP
jgi:hypothetical protein